RGRRPGNTASSAAAPGSTVPRIAGRRSGTSRPLKRPATSSASGWRASSGGTEGQSSEQDGQRPGAIDVGVARAAGGEEVAAVAGGLLEGVGKDWEEVGAGLVAQGAGQAEDGAVVAGEPALDVRGGWGVLRPDDVRVKEHPVWLGRIGLVNARER